jgi:hypothetical protein
MTKEEKREYDRLYRLKNRERIKERKKKEYLKNRCEILNKRKNYYQKNSKKLIDYQKSYRFHNIEKIRTIKRNYQKNQRKTNFLYRISKNLRSRITKLLKNNKSNYNELIGCSSEKLISHLESKFLDGMTWKNYGLRGWHIDHIKPCSVFNLTKVEEQRRCFHYSNLQPLWAKDNLRKGSKLISN